MSTLCRSLTCLTAVLCLLGLLDGAIAHAQNLSASNIFLEAPIFYSGGDFAGQALLADVNGDGKLDLIVSNGNNNQLSPPVNGGMPSVGILLGNGDGTFQPPSTLNIPGVGAVADVNGDGKVDLIVTVGCPLRVTCTGAVNILLGNGDGTFQSPVSYSSGGYSALSVAVADVNGDTKPDLVVANNCITPGITSADCNSGSIPGGVAILLGNGDGTFQAATSFPGGGRGTIALVDVNGDGKLDVLTLSNGVDVLRGNGDGTFQAAVTWGSGVEGFNPSFAAADVNRDGKPDLVLAGTSGVGVLLGNGDGTFGLAVTYSPGGTETGAVAVGDVNGDGNPDLVVSNRCTSNGDCFSSGTMAVLLGKGDGTFQPPVTYSPGGEHAASSVALGDVNGDGKLDVVLADQCVGICGTGTAGASVLLNTGAGTFRASLSYPTNGLRPEALAVGDFNGDSNPDLLVVDGCAVNSMPSGASCGSGGVDGLLNVLLGNADGTFQAAVSYASGGVSADAAVIADVNGDGIPDLLIANACLTGGVCAFQGVEGGRLSQGAVGVLLANGDGTFQTAVPYLTGANGAIGLALSDINGDGKPDLIVLHAAGKLTRLLGNGNGTFQNAVTIPATGLLSTSIALADVNRDGKPDLLLGNGCAAAGCTNGTVSVLMGRGDGTFGTPVSYASGLPALSIAVGDMNGDGKPDLVVAGAGGSGFGAGSMAVLLGNGDGTFNPARLTTIPPEFEFAVAPSAPGLALADFDGDGHLDVAFGAANVLLFGLGDGNLEPPVTLGAHGRGTAVGDFNHGGKPDLAVGAVGVLLNSPSGTASTASLLSSINPSALNETVTYTATVAGSGGVPTGNIVFSINLNKPVTVPLVNGQATYNWTFAKTGPRTVTARYNGDATFAASTSNTVQQQINPLSMTQTSLTSSLLSATTNQLVTFTATVTGQGVPAPTGTVTFTVNGNKPVTVPLNNGQATFNWTFLYAGMRTVTASYSGDGANLPSTSAMVNETISLQPTQTTLMSSLNPSVVGQAVTYTANVPAPSGPTPTGSITFAVNLSKPVVVPLVNGEATYAIAYKLAGPRTVSASYSGDSSHGASVSPTVNQTITQQPTQTTLTSSPNPSSVGQMVMFTATVAGQNGVVPTGTVMFTINLNKPVAVALANGQATFNWTFAMSGPRTVTASYTGDANNKASTSAVLNQTIN